MMNHKFMMNHKMSESEGKISNSLLKSYPITPVVQ